MHGRAGGFRARRQHELLVGRVTPFERRGDLQSKNRPVARAAFDVNFSSEKIRISLYDVKTKANAAARRSDAEIRRLTKPLEDRWDLLFCDSNSRIGNLQLQNSLGV